MNISNFAAPNKFAKKHLIRVCLPDPETPQNNKFGKSLCCDNLVRTVVNVLL